MLDLLIRLLAACLISYTIAALMPTWRALLGMTAVVCILLYSDTSRHWIASCLQSPLYTLACPCFMDNLLLLMATAGFAIGVIVRGLTFPFEARGFQPRSVIIMMRVVGAAIAPAIFLFAPNLLTWPTAWLR